jgi:phosphatidylserine/phosphatidylglycerophosphate/cardiolipin synthase-like enzyme
MTTYIDPVKAMLEQNFPQADGLWNYSADNQLDAGWLYATPTSVWTLPYSQFKQAVAGSGPLELQTCTVAGPVAGQPTQLCQAMDASMTAPGQTAAKLLVGHSDAVVDAIYDVMTSAQVLLDVTTLTPPTGRFLDAFKNALLYLSNKPAGQRPIVRILFSNPLPNIPELMAEPFISDITSQLDAAKRMQIYVYVMSSSFSSWNHAKIIAADGARAVVGGHNMWDPHYLGKNPVHDVSMRVTGSAARHAQDFADTMWRFGQYRQDHVSLWIPGPLDEQLDLIAAYAPPAESATAPSSVTPTILPDRTMYATATSKFPATGSTGTIPVLAVGRAADTQSNYLLPTPASYFFPFDEPGDQAIAKLVSLAQTTVRMSLQSFRLGPFGIVAGWNPALFQAMAEVLSRGVNIYVVLSNPGAVAGGLTAASAPYDGDSPGTVNAKMVQTVVEQAGVPQATAERIVSQQFHLAQFRYSSDATYPGGVPIGNHAKTVIVDDAAFYIGSQNMYSSNLNEFGYIVEDSATAQSYVTSYWTPLWNWSKSTVSSALDPDEQTSQQIEAMAFIRALEVDTLLNTRWAQLVNQRNHAADTGKLTVQHQMDELIASAGFDTTGAIVLAGLAQPFFTQNPPSTEATSQAIAFVANLMTDTQLMQDFSQAVYAQADSVADYNAALNKFLTSRGYTCTALQVMAAFAALRTVNLAYWSGTYTTWLTADGGVSYATASSASSASSTSGASGASGAAQPHVLQAATSTDTTPPAPALGPQLVITADSVTHDKVAIKGYSYNNNVLSWSTSDGNDTTASLQLGTVTRATMNENFTGNEMFGTITYPAASGSVASGTYSLYGRSGQAAGDSPSYTLAYIFAALGAAALLALLGYFTFKSVQRQAEWRRVAQEKDDSGEEDDSDVELEPVSSPNRATEGLYLRRAIRLDQTDTAEDSINDMLPLEPGMTQQQRLNLSESATGVRTSRSLLEKTTAGSLQNDVQSASTGLDNAIAKIQSLTSELSGELATTQRTALQQSTELAGKLSTASDDITRQEEDDEPFSVEDNL